MLIHQYTTHCQYETTFINTVQKIPLIKKYENGNKFFRKKKDNDKIQVEVEVTRANRQISHQRL